VVTVKRTYLLSVLSGFVHGSGLLEATLKVLYNHCTFVMH